VPLLLISITNDNNQVDRDNPLYALRYATTVLFIITALQKSAKTFTQQNTIYRIGQYNNNFYFYYHLILTRHIAIFALLVFFFAQFGKVINFCFCSIAVYQQTKTVNCDCEKQLSNAVNTESNSHTPHNSAEHPQLDELFHLANNTAFTIQHTALSSAWPKTGNEALYHVFGKNIFRPPLQVS
jgi:hypothetical protein